MSRSKCDSCGRVKAFEAEVAKLRRQVEDLARAGKRQAAPFSKGKPKPDPKRPGRKRGKAYGRRAFRRRPRRVDEEYDAPLPGQCTHSGCDGRVHEEGVADQYQEDTQPVRPLGRGDSGPLPPERRDRDDRGQVLQAPQPGLRQEGKEDMIDEWAIFTRPPVGHFHLIS